MIRQKPYAVVIWGLMFYLCLQLCSAQTERMESRDEVWLAGLVLGAVACSGVVVLAVVVCCLVARLRREKTKLTVSNDVSMIEKAPVFESREMGYDVNAQVSRGPDAMPRGSIGVGVGTLRQVSLSLLQDLLLNLYNVNVKRPQQGASTHSAAIRKESVVTPAGANEVQQQLKSGLVKIFPQDPAKVDTFLSLGQSIMTATTVRQLLDSTLRAMRICVGVAREWGVVGEDFEGVVPTEGQGHVTVVVEDEVNSLLLTWDSHKLGPHLLTTVSAVCQALRDERRQPTPEEYLAIQTAYHALGKGQHRTDITPCPLGTPGFHSHAQTLLALTDSGYGHVLGTARRSDWLQGVVVHVQHIGSLDGDRNLVPSLYDLSKVRLHIGAASPTTFFVSRPRGHMGEGETMTSEEWEAEVGRMVQVTANTVSAAFYQGAAACHISMTGLTTGQAATFMSQLRPHVQRERHVQALSAIWDLGTPLTDDYQAGEGQVPVQGAGSEAGPKMSGTPVVVKKTKVIEEPHHIARRAIEITLAGGFDQVTWFSSCDETTPSTSNGQSDNATCVLRRLTSQQITSLVHHAHSRGLLTYFTGGVTCPDIQPAVLGGVDGVGVGGVGMLHHPDTGRNSKEKHGPYMEENIPQVLSCRDEAARTIQGRAAHLLARLDSMMFEGSLASAENGLRTRLLDAIMDKDTDTMTSVMAKLQDVVQLPSDNGHPLMGTARRLVARQAPALKDVADSAYEWAMFVTRLKTMVGRADEAAVVEEYGGEPWQTYRKKYRARQGPHAFVRQVSFQVELKTDF